MNLFLVTGRTVFLPWSTISKRLECYWTSWEKETGLARMKVYGYVYVYIGYMPFISSTTPFYFTSPSLT